MGPTIARWITPTQAGVCKGERWKTAPWRTSHALTLTGPLKGKTLCNQTFTAAALHEEAGPPGCAICRRMLRRGRASSIAQGAKA